MPQYFDNDERIISSKRLINFKVGGAWYELYSDNGIFSKKGLDKGSKLLIETLLPLDLGDYVLDLGCGYGPIGITLALNKENLRVLMSDINKRALSLSLDNIERYHLGNRVKAIESNIYESIKDKFTSIVTNPPIRAGNKVLKEIYLGAKSHLIKGGSLYLVIRKSQGANSTLKFLKENYETVNIVNKANGYYILKATVGE